MDIAIGRVLPASKSKPRSNDRIIKLKKIDDKAYTTAGMVDSRLFNGKNNLLASRDETGIWSVKMEIGLTDENLSKKFTRFPDMMNYLKAYFRKRNVEIEEVLD